MKIGVCGICGRMGVSVLEILRGRGHVLAAAFDREEAHCFGKDAGSLLMGEKTGVTVSSMGADAVAACEGIIDFSSPAASLELITIACDKKIPLVVGTTGFSSGEKEEILKAAEYIPVLFSPNMSLGVNLLFKLAEVASRALSEEYDVEIFEAHHRFKKDAPSGTARRLLDIVRENKRGLGDAVEVAGREGIPGPRGSGEIGVLAMRGGGIVGEHTLYFVAPDERIELTHRASSRDTLARGAVMGMEFISGRPAGLYTMYDVLGW
ncbi:MAG: 4-hydroxy-tetrahydrodipicolinate reductase [Spirochaetes bacterium]|nr:4-hydroxy-tetrahydrodipicolinate reductase [Spirochaetota bacterium]